MIFNDITAQLIGVTALLLVALWRVYVWIRPTSSIQRLHGPPNPSWWVGHMPQLTGGTVGHPNFTWLRRYGRAYCAYAYFGEPMMVISDPAACSYVLKNYDAFPRRNAEIALIGYVLGKEGLPVTINEQHVRQRRVIQPAFNSTILRNLFPSFLAHADQLRHSWHSKIVESPFDVYSTNAVLDLSALTAESLAAFAFGKEMGHVQRIGKPETAYVTSLRKLFIGGISEMKNSDWVMRGISGFIPHKVMMSMSDWGLAPKVKAVLDHHNILRRFAKEVVGEQTRGNRAGADWSRRNVMGLLIKSNMEETDPTTRLREDEVLDQVASLLVGGQDTTSLEAAFVLYELALHPEFQSRLREEMRDASRVRCGGPSEYADLESLPLLTACIKETLRVHPIVPVLTRQTNRDVVVPFSDPIRLRDGTLAAHMALPKGSSIALDLAGYNRDVALWGHDADEWRPERWLNGNLDFKMHRHKKLPGMYEHLLSFSDGQANCIGWRFALVQLHTIIATLIEDFEFKLQTDRIERLSAAVMGPIVTGDTSAFALPVEIRVAADSSAVE